MANYKGAAGQTYKLEDNPFAGGGEGRIYALKGDASLVAKIYHAPLRTQARWQKLTAMRKSPPEAQAAGYYTWPKDVLYDKGGGFCGYVMQRLGNYRRLNEIYAYDQREGKSWMLYIAIGKNLAAAVDGIHQRGHVCGDLNPNNICVNPLNGLVTLVDTDSYHIRDGNTGVIHRCEVAMAEYVPPNLQGVNFKTAPLPTFTEESDRFALAVLLFSLLMNGAHPFACSVAKGVSGGAFQPTGNIAKGIYPFAGHVKGIGIPKYAPDITALPGKLQGMFASAFLAKAGGKRPTASDWYYALEELATQLTTCGKNVNHVYSKHLGACPWCQVNARMDALGGGQPRSGVKRPPIHAAAVTMANTVGASAGTTTNTVGASAAVGTTTVWSVATAGNVASAGTRAATTTTGSRRRRRRSPWEAVSDALYDVTDFFGDMCSGLYELLPYILTGILALANGGGIGYGAYWLLNHLTFTWGIIGGVIAGLAAFATTIVASEDFIDDPGIWNFCVFAFASPISSTLTAAGGVVGMIAVIFAISIALSIGSFVIGLFG